MEETSKQPDEDRISRRALLGMAGASVVGIVLAATDQNHRPPPAGVPRIRTRPLTREELYEDHDLGG